MGGGGFIMNAIKSFKSNRALNEKVNFDISKYHEKSKEPLKYNEFSKEEFKRFKHLLKIRRRKEKTRRIIVSIILNILFMYFLYWLFY